tara:strand:- start:30 stop:131 length:102 start_codon:yes stop_codon:yes gene_type:complete
MLVPGLETEESVKFNDGKNLNQKSGGTEISDPG